MGDPLIVHLNLQLIFKLPSLVLEREKFSNVNLWILKISIGDLFLE